MEFDKQFEIEKLKFEIAYKANKILNGTYDLFHLTEKLDEFNSNTEEWKRQAEHIISKINEFK